MKHYPHHISDFNNATRHLTRIERSLYRDLLDLYYETEHQLTLDLPSLCRRILANECSTDVERVLNEFFTKTPKGWYHDRCEEEIEAYKSNSSQKALAGKASAEKKRLKKLQALNGNSTHVEQPLKSVETKPQQNSTNQSTINQSTNQPSIAKAISASAPLPDGLDVDAWEKWVDYRKQIRKPLKPVSMLAAQRELTGFGASQMAVVERSIANGWTGLFPLKGVGAKPEFLAQKSHKEYAVEEPA